MDTNPFERAKQIVEQLISDTGSKQIDGRHKIAANAAIRSAYPEATPEERKQLEQFERQLDQDDKLY